VVALPTEIAAPISTYYRNNLANIVREDWEGKGFYVNWYEAEPRMVWPPFTLREAWSAAIRPLVEEW
jgi:S-formylglutathione hydrolase FrmB